MTELSFLLDLLLTHKLPKLTRDALARRIKDVEAGLITAPRAYAAPAAIPAHMQNQAPSTIAAMLKHETGGIAPVIADMPAVIAQTPAAQAALASREAVIAQAMSGKPEKGRTAPRKF